MTKIFTKINETGTLLIEALAMLGLISMVTPVLYKKAAERTTELQDINASGQLRAIATAMDAYLKDNFAKITRGDADVSGADFTAFSNQTATSASTIIDVSALKDYLPYGMMNNGEMHATKLFSNTINNGQNSNYRIVVRLNRDVENGQPVAQTLTGFIIAEPKAGLVNNTRAARIASMVGSNGGVTEVVPGTDDDPPGINVYGTQGIWNVSEGDLIPHMQANSLVISSLEPITSQGLSNENVLYRVDMPNDDDQELNSMTTDLFMGRNANSTRNIRMVNQIIMTPDASRMVNSGGQTSKTNIAGEADLAADVENALYIGNGGGANVEGALQAIGQRFQVKNGVINYFGTTTDPATGTTTNNATATFHVGTDRLVYGNPGANNLKLTVTDSSLDYGEYKLHVERDYLFSMGKFFKISSDGNHYVTIGDESGDDYEQHKGPATIYNEENIIDWKDATNYRLSVNGSIFANDTIQSGKSAAYDADSAKLRAGMDRTSFNAGIKDDEKFFMMAQKNGGESEFSLSDNGHAVNQSLVYAKTGGSNPGFTVDTSNYDGGVDLIAGKALLAGGDNTPQAGVARIGAQSGIYLSTVSPDANAFYADTPVSIQGEMLQVYDHNTNYETIDARVNRFYAVGTGGSSNDSEYNVEGMELNIGKIVDDNTYDNLGVRTIAAADRISGNAVKSRSILNIQPDNYGNPSGNEYGKVTTRITGGVGIYDHDADISANRNNPSSTANPAALFVDKGKFEIRATRTIQNGDLNKGDLILAVDNNMDDTRYLGNNNSLANLGSVYIRKGSINLDTNREFNGTSQRLTNEQIASDYEGNNGTGNPSAQENMTGYIAADRFISHYSNLGMASDTAAIQATADQATGMGHAYGDNNEGKYDKYEVNPAYTSVMHDIKLTTRGGARLSDILPDFINKGIYVVDTSYEETSVGNWTEAGWEVRNNLGNASSANTKVSAYVGFVPTPKCPPGYAKVITLTPAGWAMAQAGKLTFEGGGVGGRPDVSLPDAADVYAQNNSTDPDPSPMYLDYQKSTWLRSEVRPVYSGKMNNTGNATDFNGWGLIMGFIYPDSKYGSLAAGLTNVQSADAYYHGAGAHGATSGGTSGDTVYWNLFPVYNNEIEGYATVYCYFDRNNSNYSDDYVDKYNQLRKFNEDGAADVNSYTKGDYNASGNHFINRLNDQRLKYNDPW